jgi:hypothetical protein
MKFSPQEVGLTLFILGAVDILAMMVFPFVWKYLTASELVVFPLLALSPNPLATFLQSVFVGVVLAVRGGLIYAQRTPIPKGIVLTVLSVILIILAMITFTIQNYLAALLFFMLAMAFFAWW